MSSRAQIPLSKSLTSQARIVSPSLTPFLFLTQRLEGQSGDAQLSNQIHRTHKGYRSFCSTSQISLQANAALVQNASSSENTSLSVPSNYRIRVPGQSRKKTDSPMPQGSDEVSFQQGLIDRICSQLSHMPDYKDTAEDDMTYELGFDAYEAIAILFENAIREAKLLEERAGQHFIKHRRLYRRRHYSLSLPPLALDVSRDLGRNQQLTGNRALYAKEPLQGAFDGSNELDTSGPSEEAPRLAGDEFRFERRIHEEDFIRELERAQTDDAVWSVLETKVFSLIKTVHKRKDEEASKRDDETGSKSVAPRKPRRRKGQPEQKEPNLVSVPLQTETKVEGTPHSPSSSSSLSLVPQPPLAKISPDAISSIIQHNYGRYCLKALQLLRQHFPASLYSLMILPTIKQLGPISYVLGATSGLYNELLHLKWTEYADLHGMADILEEMRNRGVQQDRVTAAVIQVVERERETQLNIGEAEAEAEAEAGERAAEGKRRSHQRRRIEARTENIPATAAWWRLRQVQEGWTRLLDNFHAAERLTEEQRLREAQDEQDMRAVEEAEQEDDWNDGSPAPIRMVSERGGRPSRRSMSNSGLLSYRYPNLYRKRALRALGA